MLDPWQELVCGAWLGRNSRGKIAGTQFGLSAPRQNGKNGALEAVEVFKLVMDGRAVLHTAHEVRTSNKHFLRMKKYFEPPSALPEIAGMVRSIKNANGQEGIYLTNGGSLEFASRTRGLGRGFVVDDLIFDEAQELTDEQFNAAVATISSAPQGDPQIIMTGTPPGPNADGEPFLRLRKEAIGGKNKRFGWHEWSPESIPNPEDHEAVMAMVERVNPSYGVRLLDEAIEGELALMSWDGFLRERGGVWSADEAASVLVQPSVWAGLVTDDPPSGDVQKGFGVKFSPDGSRVVLAVAAREETGPVHVEVIRLAGMGEGIGWLVDGLSEAWRGATAIVVDGKSGAGDLVNLLRDHGVPARKIITPSVDDVTTAHAGWLRDVLSGDLTHIGQAGLDASVRAAGRRPIGTSGGWGVKPIIPAGDVTPLEAVVMARYGLVRSRRKNGVSTGKVVVV